MEDSGWLIIARSAAKPQLLAVIGFSYCLAVKVFLLMFFTEDVESCDPARCCPQCG